MKASDRLARRLEEKSARIGVLGLGYVGLPLAMAFAEAGFRVRGFDVDAAEVAALAAGESYIGSVATARLRAAQAAGCFEATDDFAQQPPS